MKRPINESVMSTTALRVDRKAGIIHGVKVLGLVSENGRRYTPEAVRQAARLYDGVRVNIDHPEKDATQTRSAYDRLGRLTNIRFVEGEGLYGDLEILMTHPMAKRICEAAERMPDAFGLSHNAQGEGEENKEGVFVVSKIVEVRHVDLVADPATTRSLSESKNTKEPAMDEKLQEALGAMREAMANLEGRLKEAYGDDDTDADKDEKTAMEAESDEPAEDEDAEDAEEIEEEDDDQEAPIEEEADDEDAEKAEYTAEEADDEDGADDDKRDRKGAMEAREPSPSKMARLIEENRALKRRERLRRLCAYAGLKADRALLEDLAGLSKDAATRTIQRLALAQKATKPRSAGYAVTESKSGDGIPAGDALFNWLAN